MLKRYTARHGSMLFLLAIIVLLLLNVIISFILESFGIKSGSEEFTTYSLVGSSIIELGLIAAFFIYNKTQRLRPRVYLTKPKLIHVGFAVIAPVFCLIFFYPISAGFMSLLNLMGYKMEGDPFVWGNTVQKIFLFVGPVLLAPIGEELIFRSGLISGLTARFSNIKTSLLCGLAFSLMHMNPDQTMYQFCLGFTLSYLAITSNSVIPAIIAHLLNNLIGAFKSIGVTLADGNIFKTIFYDSFVLYENILSRLYILIPLCLLFTAAGGFIIIKLCERYKTTVVTENDSNVDNSNVNNSNVNNSNANNSNVEQPTDKKQAFRQFWVPFISTLLICFIMWGYSFAR